MKKLTLNLVLVFSILGILLTACNKDDKEEVEKKQELTFGDKSFDLAWGMTEYYGKLDTKDEAYNFDLMLLSSGLEYVDSLEEFTGKGSGIYFEMFSESSAELVSGTYELDTTSTFAKPFTFDYGNFVYNYDMELGNGEDDIDITAGTVKIEKSGDVYEITVECVGDNGVKVSGYYKGTLKSYDYSKKKSISVKKRWLK